MSPIVYRLLSEYLSVLSCCIALAFSFFSSPTNVAVVVSERKQTHELFGHGELGV